MGQKTNPNILRIGKTKAWKSKYIEKKSTESSTMIFRELEIQKFISQLFINTQLKIQNLKIYYSETSLHIYISYYNSIKPIFLKETTRIQSLNILSQIFKKKIAKIKQLRTKKLLYTAKIYFKTLNDFPRPKLFHNQYLLNKKTHRLNSIKYLKNYIERKTYKTLNQQKDNLFNKKILKSLNLFTHKTHNIFLNLKQINKETTFLQTVSKKNKGNLEESFTKLRRFHQTEFFKRGFNMLYNFTKDQQNPAFLAEFIAFYLKKLKRPNFFLRFLKLALSTLKTANFCQFERIQIKIKGRFNGAPRSTHKIINVGKNIPVLTLNSKVNYGESIAYTSNGTFGIKVWTYTESPQNYNV